MKAARIIRADALRTSANAGKIEGVLRFVRDFRRVAQIIGREQWRLVFSAGRTNKTSTAKTVPLPPGVFGPPLRLSTFCGAAPVQMARYQVAEQIDGWLANRANEFTAAVQTSSLDPETKHRLHALNRRDTIYLPGAGDFTLLALKDRKGHIVAPQLDISEATRRLARNVMRGVMRRHRKPSLANISPRLDSRCAELETAKTAAHAEFWLKLRLPNRGTVMLPLHDTQHRKARNAPLCGAVQLVTDNGGLSVRVMSDVTETYAADRAAYVPEMAHITLDFGLTTMFATSEGDLLGRDWLTRLRRYDAKLQPLARHMQKIGRKPRDSRRYRELAKDVRGFVRSETNRVMNALIAARKPAHLVLERLDFRHADLSARLNRILRNCGRSVIKAKLADLEQRRGVTSEAVNPAYSSQECELCGFVSRDNRPSQSRFACRWCGHTAHADVNATRVLRSRRSGSPGALAARGQKGALAQLACWFGERMKTQASGRRGDVLRKSAFARRLGADQIAAWLTPQVVACV